MPARIPDHEPLHFLVGPTAAGKSSLGVRLSEACGAEILTLDSMQVYRGMDVGTAKPSAEDQARVPHHLIDLADPTERYHVHRYLEDSARVWHGVRERGRRSLFVGGTGFYLKALTHGLFEGPPLDEEVRAELNARAEAEGSATLHAELREVDPASAERIHPNDAKRVVRGLETFRTSGRPLSDWQREWNGPEAGRPRRIVALQPAAETLEARIRARTDAMLAAGWVAEVERILAGGGFGPTSEHALGYPEIVRHLAGEIAEDELAAAIALRTRQFARRQRTWFRGFPEIVWIDPDAVDALDQARAALGWA